MILLGSRWPGPRSVDRLIGVLLRLYPAEFRREFGAEMASVYRAEARAAASRSAGRAARFWIRSILVTCACAAGEHAAGVRDRVLGRDPQRRREDRRTRFAALRARVLTEVRDGLAEVERRRTRTVLLTTLAAGVIGFAFTAWGIGQSGLSALPYPDGDRLVSLETAFPGMGYESFPLSAAEFLAVERRSRSFESLGAWQSGRQTVVAAGKPSREQIVWATPGWFASLGLPLPEVDPAGPRQAFVTASFWEDYQLGADAPDGLSLKIGERTVRLAGALPASFRFWMEGVSVFIVGTADPAPGLEAVHELGVVGRLREGVELAEAREEADRLTYGWPGTSRGVHGPTAEHPLRVRPLDEALLGRSGPPLRLLLLSSALLLAVALVHLSCLGASFARGRRRLSGFIEYALPIAVGVAAGASVSTLVLAAGPGGAFGNQWETQGPLPLLGLIALAPVAIILALAARRKERPTARLIGGLAMLDLAMSVGLLFGAGLLARSIANVGNADAGFETRGLVTFDAAVPSPGSAGPDDVLAFARTLPGVTHSALASSLPVSPDVLPSDVNALRPGSDTVGPTRRAYIHFVSAGFQATLGMRLLRGRDIAGNGEALVSRTLALRLWPDGDALGSRLRQSLPGAVRPDATVVGIVDDVPQTSLAQGETAQLFLSRDLAAGTGHGPNQFYVLVRSDQPRLAAARLSQPVVLGGQAIPTSRPLRFDDLPGLSTRRHRLLLGLMVVAALLGLALGIGCSASASGATGCPPYFRPATTLPGGLAGGLLLAIPIRGGLDPLVVGTGLGDPPVLGLVACGLVVWVATMLCLRRLPTSS